MFKMNYFLLFFIIAYFLYSFFKVKKAEKKIDEIVSNDNKKEENDYYRFLIVAAVASVMGDKKYRIKRIFFKPELSKRESLWKIRGRIENTLRSERR